jgi:phage tail sheath gpL-like
MTVSLSMRVPGTYVAFDNSAAVQGLVAEQERALIVGPMTSNAAFEEGVGDADTLYRITNGNIADGYFGPQSILAAACRAFLLANPNMELWAAGQADGTTAAAGDVVFTGTATAAGALNLYVAGLPVRVAVAVGDTGAAVSAALETAIAARTDLPCTAADVAGTLTFTAANKGLLGNSISIFLNWADSETTPAGITVDLSDLTTNHYLKSGAVDAVLTSTISAMMDEQYHYVFCCYNDATTTAALGVEMKRRWTPEVRAPGCAFICARKLHATAITWGELWNHEYTAAIPYSTSPTPPWVWGAAWMGAISKAASESIAAKARPFRGIEIPGVLAPKEGTNARWDLNERNQLLWAGCSTYTVDAGGRAVIERVITTYRENAIGAPDTSYLNLQTVLSSMAFSTQWWTRFASRYVRHGLADDTAQLRPNLKIVRPKDLVDEGYALCRELEAAGLVENVDDLVINAARSLTDVNRVDMTLSPDWVNQFLVFDTNVQFVL